MDVAERFAEQGCLKVDRLFDPQLITAVHDEYQAQFGQLGEADLDRFLVVGDRRMQAPILLRGALLDPMLTANPLLLAMLEGLLGKDFLIDSVTCVVALDGAKDQGLHRDHHQLFPGAEEAGERLAPYAVTVAVPLIDLTPATGTTRMFPRSHRLPESMGERPHGLGEGEEDYVQRGGCYFMDYRLWHHGTANRSGQPRPILYVIYARYWFTDTLNFAGHPRLRMAREELLAMPPVQRRLFRRLAAKGAHDLTEAELMGSVGGSMR